MNPSPAGKLQDPGSKFNFELQDLDWGLGNPEKMPVMSGRTGGRAF